MNLPTNLKIGVIALTIVIIVGTSGFMVLGDLGVGDSLYLTMITVTTLGFGFLSEPLTGPEKFWLVLVLIAGMGAALYTLTAFVEYGVETLTGSDHRRRRKMTREIQALSHHVIICGYGRVGATACDTLTRNRIPVVVIEANPAVIQRAIEDGVTLVEGDATRDEVLIEAGIERRAERHRLGFVVIGQPRHHAVMQSAPSRDPGNGSCDRPPNGEEAAVGWGRRRRHPRARRGSSHGGARYPARAR